jgi:mono/diheme cytochrome c family protein
MKKKLIIVSSFLAILLTVACQDKSKNTEEVVAAPTDKTAAPPTDPVERGRYLVEIMVCADCHSPKKMTPQGPVPDMDRFLSGHPSDEVIPPYDKSIVKKGLIVMSPGITSFAGPWGTSFAANLTPDASGLGNWTLDNFKKALREGKSKGLDGSRMLLPPMPWQHIGKMTDEDIDAVFQYLKSLKPVENVVPAPLPPGA